MKKIYFSGKFNRIKEPCLSLVQSLENDYRAHILGSSRLLTFYTKDLIVDNRFIYSGPFYCEQASNGKFTSNDCKTVLRAELAAVKNCDVFFAVFNESFSVGSIVELEWALLFKKEIVILYKEEESAYQIKSEYWFAIADALRQSPQTKIYSYCDNNDLSALIQSVLKEVVCHEI